jgi:hypothetical protein
MHMIKIKLMNKSYNSTMHDKPFETHESIIKIEQTI